MLVLAVMLDSSSQVDFDRDVALCRAVTREGLGQVVGR
jgi:hypothetical protein